MILGRVVIICHPPTQDVGSKNQGHPQLCNEFKASPEKYFFSFSFSVYTYYLLPYQERVEGKSQSRELTLTIVSSLPSCLTLELFLQASLGDPTRLSSVLRLCLAPLLHCPPSEAWSWLRASVVPLSLCDIPVSSGDATCIQFYRQGDGGV